MSTFAKICFVIPIHTAGVERTFSQLKLIKTRIRNRLSEDTLPVSDTRNMNSGQKRKTDGYNYK